MRQTTVATIGILVAFGLVFAPAATATHGELSQTKDYINPGHPRQGFISIFGFNGLTLRIDCTGSLAGVGINCVEFELTGAEHEVDIQIADTVLDQSRRQAERTQRLFNDVADDGATFANEAVIDPAQDEANGELDAAQDDVQAEADFVSDETGDSTASDAAATANGEIDGAQSSANAEADSTQASAAAEYEAAGDEAQAIVNPLADDVIDWRPVSAVYSILGGHGNGVFCNTQVLILPPDANSLRVTFDGVGFGNAFLSRCGTTFSGAIAGSVHLNVEVDP